ncbi:MAG: nucleotidyltransferase domain-containing protein [Ginsengibacter sp.]
MLSSEQNNQFHEILDELSRNLDITPAQYEAAVKSYQFVGDWLSRPESPLAPYAPEIEPQGSFLLGTMTRPINEEDDLDVDLVCRLTGKRISWTQYDVKKIVGDRLKSHDMLKRMLDREGRRCWTLLHKDDAKFHLDILPAIVSSEYKLLFEQKLYADNIQDVEKLAIRITDNTMANYFTSNDLNSWLKSNPFGYALWFKFRSQVEMTKLLSLNEAIKPLPPHMQKKLPLQIIVQLLKRHRDIMFNGDEDKPISIIITTLAARAYKQQTNIIQGLIDVINIMENYIEERIDSKGQRIKWISNPVNASENFADKWPDAPNKKDNFYKWLSKVKSDLGNITVQRGYDLQLTMADVFGKRDVNKTFSNLAESARAQRESGRMKMAAGTGIISSLGRTVIASHTNFGASE